MYNYTPISIYGSDNSTLGSNADDYFVTYRPSYKAYVTPKTSNTYGLLENTYIIDSIKEIDHETQDNYSSFYTKNSRQLSINDLLYERYYTDAAQTNNLWQRFSDKLTKLKDIIGSDLFGKLKFDQQLLMASTMGVIDADYIDSKSVSTITTR